MEDATDSQLNTVVSGALDRLHSTADPCVSYSQELKLWIYLHRNRSEADFGIHNTYIQLHILLIIITEAQQTKKSAKKS